MHAPPGFAPRPPITGWFAEFEDLSLPPGTVGYAKDATGSLARPSTRQDFIVLCSPADACGERADYIDHLGSREALQHRLLDAIDRTPLDKAELLNPLDGDHHARFLAFRSKAAQRWYAELKGRNVITDVRGDVLRIGFGIYQDEGDVSRLVNHLRELQP